MSRYRQQVKALDDVKNFFLTPTSGNSVGYPSRRPPATSLDARKNLTYTISPIQFARIRHDIKMWFESIVEAENAYYPFRVRMQRMFQSTILNEHVTACWERRKNLTLLRDYKLGPAGGDEDEAVTLILKNTWFNNFVSYALDAIGFGYTLLSLGDIVDDKYPNLSIIRRQNISPDRKNVSTFPNTPGGRSWEDPLYKPWHIWVPTVSDLGISNCGYGLFYKIAKAEIYIRNNTAYNADFQELFGQPVRVGKTQKTEEAERAAFANQLANMGASAWILLDEGTDDIELLESRNTGTAYLSFSDFEKRNENKISKVILGHADAIDSTPGKLGAGQKDGEESPVSKALDAIQVKDGAFIEDLVNDELLPRMREQGFKIPITYKFQYYNDKEEEEFREREDKSNLATATVALTMKNAGLKMDAKYFEDRTGIPTEDAPDPLITALGPDGEPMDPTKKKAAQDGKTKMKPKTQSRLNKLYNR